ncbi:hypothetical protein JI435_307070 [Parastagonospora nodorum SN15]|uniref:Uncharacterized protein n=1 Tax=Phaeosphaeria nodorum (strain SN15 / ATCC MYA-4574 / FGSC 10173) TaxID=321614 RepID=A0A7U2FK12_PHANO|nr:hypothetical protein JI435_307070 [Parastagonospora nodorum SN15]
MRHAGRFSGTTRRTPPIRHKVPHQHAHARLPQLHPLPRQRRSQFYLTHLTAAQDEGLEDKYTFAPMAYANIRTPGNVERLVLFREEW